MEEKQPVEITLALQPFVERRALATDWVNRKSDQKGYRGGIGMLVDRDDGIYLAVRAVSDEGEDVMRNLRIVPGFEVQIYSESGNGSTPTIEKRYLF